MAPLPKIKPQAATVPSFDEAAIREHCEMLHALAAGLSGKFVVSTFFANPGGEDRAGGVISHHNVGDVEGTIESIMAHAGTPNANTYLCPNLMRANLERGKKGAESDVVAVLALVADMDGDTGRSGDMPLSPNYVVESSEGNFQCLLLLDAPMAATDAKALAGALKRAAGCDHCTMDVSHVWRVPGTLNWPNAKKIARGRSPEPQPVTVFQIWAGDLTSVDELRIVLQPWATAHSEASSVQLGELPSADSIIVTDGAAALLAANDVGDRSSHAARVVERLAFDGLTAEQAAALFLAASGDWLDRYATSERATRDFERLWPRFGQPHVEARSRAPVTLKIKSGSTQPVAANDNTPTPVTSNDLPFVYPSKWQGQAVPPRKWLIEKLIPMRTVTLLSGDGGLGKSLFALQTSVATVLGKEVAGLEPAQGRVLYVGAEDEVDEFHRRINDVLAEHGAAYEDLGDDFLLLPLADRDATLALPEKSGRINPTPLFDSLRGRIAEFRPKLLVLDTSADLYGGNEIDRTQVRQFVAMLRSIAIECNCAIVLLSHPSVAGMQSGSGTSGSTAWNNSVRARLYLTAETGDGADPDGRVLTNMKSNYGAKGEAIKLRWYQGVFVLNDGSRPNPARRLMEKRADGVFLALLSKFNRQGNNVSHVSGTNYAPAKMAAHADSGGVGKKALGEAMSRLLDAETIKIVEDGPPSKPRKRLIISAEDYGAK